MPGPSSSQEIALEYFTLQAPDSVPVVFARRVMEGLHKDVSEVFAEAPHRSPETGGILLGRHEQDRIVVEDFEPVPSEHRFGPSYRLSETDCELLLETLEWFRGGGQPGIAVLGFYRSHTVPDFALCPEDEELMRGYFQEGEDLVILVKPGLMGFSVDDFFIRRGRVVPPEEPSSPPPLLWPPPRAREDSEAESRTRRRWPWYAAVAVLGLSGSALGYLWLQPHAGTRKTTIAAPSAPAAPPVLAAVEGEPAPPGPDIAGIHSLLDSWSKALRRGDAEAAAQCYAPVVSTYFTRHDVSRDAVLQSLRRSRERYGRLEFYRISGLGITPVSEDRAVATFRKHWKIAGRGRSAEEEEERMTLVRDLGAWQISSEQAAGR